MSPVLKQVEYQHARNQNIDHDSQGQSRVKSELEGARDECEK